MSEKTTQQDTRVTRTRKLLLSGLGLAIDPITGELTVHPTLLGSYAVGVRVREFRNGELLSASIRDVRFDVVACDAFIASVIADQTVEDR